MVQDNDGYLVGLVLSYIDGDGAMLHSTNRSDPKFSDLRKKLVDQISHTLKSLHSRDIIWGDAKAENVLIDGNKDAYLIDLVGVTPRVGSTKRSPLPSMQIFRDLKTASATFLNEF